MANDSFDMTNPNLLPLLNLQLFLPYRPIYSIIQMSQSSGYKSDENVQNFLSQISKKKVGESKVIFIIFPFKGSVRLHIETSLYGYLKMFQVQRNQIF